MSSVMHEHVGKRKLDFQQVEFSELLGLNPFGNNGCRRPRFLFMERFLSQNRKDLVGIVASDELCAHLDSHIDGGVILKG